MSNSSSFILFTHLFHLFHTESRKTLLLDDGTYHIREKPCEGPSEFICDGVIGKEEGTKKVSELVARSQLTKDAPFNNIC